MRKFVRADNLEFVNEAEAFDKKDYEQLIIKATGEVTVSHADTAEGDFVEVEKIEAESGEAVEFNLVGAKQFVKVEGAAAAFLADKGDVHDVKGKKVPTDVEPRPVHRIDDKRI